MERGRLVPIQDNTDLQISNTVENVRDRVFNSFPEAGGIEPVVNPLLEGVNP